MINKLTGKNRVIVSDIAGTTRDAIDTELNITEKNMYLLILPDFDERIRLKKNGALQYYPYSNCSGTRRCGYYGD